MDTCSCHATITLNNDAWKISPAKQPYAVLSRPITFFDWCVCCGRMSVWHVISDHPGHLSPPQALTAIPANTRRSPDVGTMLGQRRRRWPLVVTALGDLFVFARMQQHQQMLHKRWLVVGPTLEYWPEIC